MPVFAIVTWPRDAAGLVSDRYWSVGRIDEALGNPVAEFVLAAIACLGAAALIFGIGHHPWLTAGAILVAYGALFAALFRRSRRLAPQRPMRHTIAIAAVFSGIVLGIVGSVAMVFWAVYCSCLG